MQKSIQIFTILAELRLGVLLSRRDPLPYRCAKVFKCQGGFTQYPFFVRFCFNTEKYALFRSHFYKPISALSIMLHMNQNFVYERRERWSERRNPVKRYSSGADPEIFGGEGYAQDIIFLQRFLDNFPFQFNSFMYNQSSCVIPKQMFLQWLLVWPGAEPEICNWRGGYFGVWGRSPSARRFCNSFAKTTYF